MSVNACKSFASVSKQAGYRRFGGDCKGAKKGLYTGTMALSIIAGIIYVVGLVACAFFAATLVHNKTKARARLQYLVQSGVIASGAFCSFIATILWTAATEGMLHLPFRLRAQSLLSFLALILLPFWLSGLFPVVIS